MIDSVMHQLVPALATSCWHQHDPQCAAALRRQGATPTCSSSETSVPDTPVRVTTPVNTAAPKRKLCTSATDSTRRRSRRRCGDVCSSGSGGGSSSADGPKGAFLALLAVAAHEKQVQDAQRAAAAHRPAQSLWQANMASCVAAALATLPLEEQLRVQEARRFLALF